MGNKKKLKTYYIYSKGEIMKKIVYFDVQEDEFDFLKRHNENKYDYYLTDKSLNNIEKIPENLRNADIISCFTTSRIDKKVLKQFTHLKLIALRSVGFNHVDIDYCRKNKICVVNTPNYGNRSVAEFAFGLMLDINRKITHSYINLNNGKIIPKISMGNELYKKTIGIIGLGAIGEAFANLAYGFNMHILAYDLKEKKELKTKYNIKYTDFDTLLNQSDFISIHAPLTKTTYHMFNEKNLNKMKNSAFLINTARGELIDTQALFNSLIQNKIAGAALDVLESEETITDDDYLIDINRLNNDVLKQTILKTKLQQLENVIITPHIAYNTHEAINRILETTMFNINTFIEGHIKNSVY